MTPPQSVEKGATRCLEEGCDRLVKIAGRCGRCYMRLWRARHANDDLRNTVRAKDRQYRRNKRATDPEGTKAYNAAYRKAHPEQFKNYQMDRRLKVKGHRAITPEEWDAIKKAQKHKCHYCGAKKPLEREHKIPLCRGGTNTPDNIAGACASCNKRKGKLTDAEFFQRIAGES